MSTIAQYMAQWLEYSDGFVAAQLARSRHDSVVISRDAWMCLDAFPYRPRHRLYLRGSGPLRPAVLDAQLSAWLKLSRAELLHVHFGWPAPDVLRTVQRWGTPYVLSVHGTDVTGFANMHPGYYTDVIDAVDAVIVPSQYLAGRAAALGFDPAAISVIPSGIDTSFFTPAPLPDGPPVVAFVGRLVEVKGIDVLLRAWPSIRSQVPEATLQVLGYGELEHLLDEMDGSVRYIRPDSSRRHEQVREVMWRASVVVTPSRTASNGARESLLLVNLEAGACGRPVVSTNYGGIPEFVADGQTGLLVPEGDEEALAAAVVRVLSDRELAARLGSAAAAHVAPWDVRGCAAHVDDVYDQVLARQQRRRASMIR